MHGFDRENVVKSFERQVFARGQEYLDRGRVLVLNKVDENEIKGIVAGTDSQPYVVQLTVDRARSQVITSCDCPYGEQCKHGAAVALFALQDGLLNESEAQEKDEAPLPYEIASWLESIKQKHEGPLEVPEEAKQRVVYVLTPAFNRWGAAAHVVSIFNRSLLKDGGMGTATAFKVAALDGRQWAKHVNSFDRDLISDLNRNCTRTQWSKPEFPLAGKHGARLLREIVRSGRAYLGSINGPNLKWGERTRGEIEWVEDKSGVQSPSPKLPFPGLVLQTNPPMYVNGRNGEVGLFESDLAAQMLVDILRAPPLLPEHVEAARRKMAELDIPAQALPKDPKPVERIAPQPVPCLKLETVICEPQWYGYAKAAKPPSRPVPFAKMSFDYDGVNVSGSEQAEIRKVLPDRVRIIKRNLAEERKMRSRLELYGWGEAKYAHSIVVPSGRGTSYCMEPGKGMAYMAQFQTFLEDAVPVLEGEGWLVEAGPMLRFVSDDKVTWDVGLQGDVQEDWFEFRLGIVVDGERHDLRPVFEKILKERAQYSSLDRWSRKAVDESGPKDIFVDLPGGRFLRLPRERLDALLKPLIELFGTSSEWPNDLKLPKHQLLDSEELAASALAAGIEWKSSEELKELAERMASFGVLTDVPEPAEFHATLRPYQREGLAWLQFLRTYGFGGILADDMGLGKTVQLLAHLQTERLAGRLDKPCLVIAPTSTLPNWKREAERFTPGLRVLLLHGPNRTELYDKVSQADLILTNYALLSRDAEKLAKEEFHLLVLDEAQNIKNATTAQARAARDLKARNRLCMTGTPLENHLDELWSLFHFLMPGFLGTSTQFRRVYRGPIEQKGDEAARTKLAKRVRPFILRRTKQQVLTELPSKTETIESVELLERQRDLYETIRLAMDKRVRDLLANQGLQRSRIEILDALLKLRQVCCDPRLVKLDSAKAVTESAKLNRLEEMLNVLLEEGRRVLIFSQFTSMLDLIEERLEGGPKWVRLDGSTKDRENPVKTFESGEVPLFLISLKAGGTGLNLVSADTVIHYDPWWNPAVENQATDRAYRIGQTKPVSVYKLVTIGTVEEKIIELQKRKGELVANMLSDAESVKTPLAPEDFQWLFDK